MEVRPQAEGQFHGQMRYAMVQALCEGINLSDDEADHRMSKLAQVNQDVPFVHDPKGNKQRGANRPGPLPIAWIVAARLLLVWDSPRSLVGSSLYEELLHLHVLQANPAVVYLTWHAGARPGASAGCV